MRESCTSMSALLLALCALGAAAAPTSSHGKDHPNAIKGPNHMDNIATAVSASAIAKRRLHATTAKSVAC